MKGFVPSTQCNDRVDFGSLLREIAVGEIVLSNRQFIPESTREVRGLSRVSRFASL